MGSKNAGTSGMNASVNWLRIPMYNAIFSTLSNSLGPEFLGEKWPLKSAAAGHHRKDVGILRRDGPGRA